MIGLPYRNFVLRAVLFLAVFAGGGALLAVARGRPLPVEMIVAGVLGALAILMVGLVVLHRASRDQDRGA